MKRKKQDPRIAQKVIEMVAAHYNTTPNQVVGAEGYRTAQQVIMYTLKVELGSPVRTAREAVNVRSDPTVYAAIKAVKILLKKDPALAEKIEEIKAEVLMIATSAETATPLAATGNTERIIDKVQRAVREAFLGDVLRSPNPAAEVLYAKDAVVFLVWDDFPKIPTAELLTALQLNQDDLHRSIGRIVVDLKVNWSDLKRKLKEARAEYSSV